ncbi:hypothetical protein GALL_547560 [mine drainage metagenome]|uniref:Uncharacterized protein n=1 Tax=mine drainage metagenome TaxID=410659 RepID=A0A1J5P7E0_9ZZZZ
MTSAVIPGTDFHRAMFELPLRKAVGQASSPKSMRAKSLNSFKRQGAVGAPAIGYDFKIWIKVVHFAFKIRQCDVDSPRYVTGGIFFGRSHIQHRNQAITASFDQFGCRDGFKTVPLRKVAINEIAHFVQMTFGDPF